MCLLLPVAQAGVESVWSPDGGQRTVLQDVGTWVCCAVHSWVRRWQGSYQICRQVWPPLGQWKGSCLEQNGALDPGCKWLELSPGLFLVLLPRLRSADLALEAQVGVSLAVSLGGEESFLMVFGEAAASQDL